MTLLYGYLADLEDGYVRKAVQQGDTDYAKGQLNAIQSLRKDLLNMKLDTNAETPQGDT